MKSSRYAQNLPALVVGFLCLLIASPALAHPGSLWGIDMTSVVTLRDQARVVGHSQSDGDPDDEVHRLERVRTIVIDPGHGGDNSGATGVAGVPEKYLTLELAYQLREELQEKYPDLRVILTRYWDTTMELSDRVHLANLANADLFLSLHYNAAPHDRAIGFETYFLRPQEVTPGQKESQGLPVATTDPTVTGVEAPIEGVAPFGHSGDVLTLIEQDLLLAHQHDLSGALAETVQDRFRHHIDSIDRGVKQANFKVLRGAHMPAVVVEAGFVTHPEEGMEILSAAHRSKVSQALVEAVEAFDGELADRFQDSEPADDGEPAQEDFNDLDDEPATEPGEPIAKIDLRR